MIEPRLIDHIRRCNELSRRERPGWHWDPPKSRQEVRRREGSVARVQPPASDSTEAR